jgi:hypothetical protein
MFADAISQPSKTGNDLINGVKVGYDFIAAEMRHAYPVECFF